MQRNTTETLLTLRTARLRCACGSLAFPHPQARATTNSNNKRDGALVEAIHTQTARALVVDTVTTFQSMEQQPSATRQPLQVEAYASALAQGARALSASGHAAAMVAVVGDVLAGDVVKIQKKTKSAGGATTTTTTTTTTQVCSKFLLI